MVGQSNRVRERREALGLSQIELAGAARLSRQSVGAIEAGRATPGVDVALRLAKALECTVEHLFEASRAEPLVTAAPLDAPFAGRAALARIGGRWIAAPLDGGAAIVHADGIAALAQRDPSNRRAHRHRLEIEPLGATSDASENLFVMGCATALGLLADRLNARSGPGRCVWVRGSSTKALEALARRRVHVAGVHLVDARTGSENVADVRRHTRREATVLVTLARWQEGLLVAAGNPKKIRRAADLARPGLRLVAREPGSGARRLLDRTLRAEGITASRTHHAALRAAGHLDVARAVSIDAADVGVATHDAAIAFGLHFVPLAEERYDLVLSPTSLRDPRVERLLETMTSAPLRRELTALGYDVRSCGDRVAELPAA
jgi:molybdate-binding protein/DNA-binding XRE family transcriptional regulator